MNAVLRVQNLSGGYGRLSVFNDISFTIDRGRTCGLLGANGAGKTTLLKSIVGALPTSRGHVVLQDQDVTHFPAFRRARAGLNLVPEGRHILGTLTVEDNLRLTRTIEGHHRDLGAFDSRLVEVYAMFPRLKERRTQLGGSLSGGEQQMLAIARALLLDPKILILDEPTQGLAPIIIQQLAETLASFNGRFAMLIVEQNRTFLERLTDRILYMDGGRIISERTGTAPAAPSRPTTNPVNLTGIRRPQ
jgi:branched-chain amino acid transport system ATP-binding protein